jgi:IS66 C-terminal element
MNGRDIVGLLRYLKGTLTKIAEGHPINKIDQLMPWQMSAPAPDQPE